MSETQMFFASLPITAAAVAGVIWFMRRYPIGSRVDSKGWKRD